MPSDRSIGRTIGRIAIWTFACLALVVAVLVVFIAKFDWNRARPWIDDKASQALGRPFAINGDLRVAWQRPPGEQGGRAWVPWPRLTAYRITLGNPPWTHTAQFATFDAISFEIEALPLLAHRIVVPSIDLVNPSIDLERLADGRDNWTFTLPESTQPSRWTLRLSDLSFAKGQITLADAMKKVTLRIGVDTLGQPLAIGDVLKQQEASAHSAAAQVVGARGASQLAAQTASAASAASAAGAAPGAPARPHAPQSYALGWSARGTYRDTRVQGSGKIGSVLALRDASRPFPLAADVKIGDTRLALVGTLTDPAHLAALDLRVWFEGASLSHLYPILGITLPDTPPYATDGHLVGRLQTGGNVFTYSGFAGRVGGSDLSGTLTFEAREPRPFLHGDIVSNLLRFADLAPIIGADTNASKARRGVSVRQPLDRVLPVETFHTDRWRAIDTDVTFTGRRLLKDPRLPITDLNAHVVVKDGVLTFDPLRFGVAGGTLASQWRLDGSTVPLKARMTMTARHLKLKQLFPTEKTMQSALGEINGDAQLTALGNSPAALGATADGEVKALVTQGTVSRLLMEEAGLNVANVLYEKLFGEREVNIHCAAADFVATHGVLDARTFAFDTDDGVIVVNGHVDLRDESLDLTVHPKTKGLRIFSLRSPLYAKGTLKHPDVGVDKGALALRAGAMVGLGLLTPFAALVPLIAPSHNQPTPCEALITQMQTPPRAGA
ncbi:AsmA family protein [Trinickia fusca]|uniref:AsmA family protein n=1 Tax=Trinickia fusca TaxID=2419777 RepID=A0A494XT60_9BURK|nr:AsmA family protein [Trinickia fusca]RKP52831.1 AsmA family protein [Trinickia fusca]